jgi:hypothetical protein
LTLNFECFLSIPTSLSLPFSRGTQVLARRTIAFEWRRTGAPGSPTPHGGARVREQCWAQPLPHIHTRRPRAPHTSPSPNAPPASLGKAGARGRCKGTWAPGRRGKPSQSIAESRRRTSPLPPQPPHPRQDSITFRCGPLNKTNLPGQEARF